MTIENVNKYLESDDLAEKLKDDFLRTQKNAFEDIMRAINDGERETAKRLAHSLKGLAGLIHEDALMQAAKNVEVSMSLWGATEEELATLEAELNRVLGSIVPKKEVEDTTPKILNKTTAKETFDKIAPLLASHNTDVFQFVDELREVPDTGKIIDQIESFEFGQALSALTALKETLEL